MKPIQTPGAISWPELETSDVEGASAFYSKIFGWEMQFMEYGTGKYGVGSLDKNPIAGIGQAPDTKSASPLPIWSYYVTVENVDTSLKKAVELGATIVVQPLDIPGVGIMGVFQDPQGAQLSVMAYHEPEHELHQLEHEASYGTHGAFSWFELRTPDAARAVAFYSVLFGWQSNIMEMEMGAYHVVSVGGTQMGGIMSVSPDQMPPHWGAFVTVNDASVFTTTVKEAGGTILHGPHHVPSVGYMVMFSDPQGGVLSGMQYVMPEAGSQ